ncbi:hypothetical protein RHO13_03400 [Orbus wheelerorum]|uniref:hypothetical protein n=1 Tax=Orbus wheelerorum TaxID=3074111 RepID=UPI00370D119B
MLSSADLSSFYYSPKVQSILFLVLGSGQPEMVASVILISLFGYFVHISRQRYYLRGIPIPIINIITMALLIIAFLCLQKYSVEFNQYFLKFNESASKH